MQDRLSNLLVAEANVFKGLVCVWWTSNHVLMDIESCRINPKVGPNTANSSPKEDPAPRKAHSTMKESPLRTDPKSCSSRHLCARPSSWTPQSWSCRRGPGQPPWWSCRQSARGQLSHYATLPVHCARTCCSCWSFRLLPTIIFSTMKSSPLLI